MATKLCSRAFRQFWNDEEGQDTVEYALVAVFMALAAVAVFDELTSKVAVVFSYVGSTLTTAL